jgi:hypothetical protein
MDYIAVMVPESALPAARAVVREVEAQLVEAREAIDDPGDLAGDGSMVIPC